jgi:hypothetical protein
MQTHRSARRWDGDAEIRLPEVQKNLGYAFKRIKRLYGDKPYSFHTRWIDSKTICWPPNMHAKLKE